MYRKPKNMGKIKALAQLKKKHAKTISENLPMRILVITKLLDNYFRLSKKKIQCKIYLLKYF